MSRPAVNQSVKHRKPQAKDRLIGNELGYGGSTGLGYQRPRIRAVFIPSQPQYGMANQQCPPSQPQYSMANQQCCPGGMGGMGGMAGMGGMGGYGGGGMPGIPNRPFVTADEVFFA
ncbi:unnamed protein product [Adineta steineri]|uniref:Uncharacterized protein n=1 Tax=Adineta steineri TaxID=433720 RepID=A0A820F293_9BILA|nr:unnamed protein product [Adineta steineri]CAF1448201.1 unnamed protein product [Adineta steineri]CAF4105149.1 unnamed protein product [Adineta steineri]CAF4255026.1 unnamed protein product [Adineta steineri]